MKTSLTLLSLVALGLVMVPPCLAFGSGEVLGTGLKTLMLTGTALWFATATPLSWLRQKTSEG